jgi:hypothetical protein
MRDSLLRKNRGPSYVASYTGNEGRVLRGVRVGGKGSECCSKSAAQYLKCGSKERDRIWLSNRVCLSRINLNTSVRPISFNFLQHPLLILNIMFKD